MKKMFLLLIFLNSFIFSAIDESKIDVYFGNGILTKEKSAKDNAYLLKDAIKQKFGLNYYHKHIGKVDYAYNHTWDRSHDMLEAYIQLDREAPDFFDKLRTFWGRFFSNNAIDKIDDEIAAAKVDEALVKAVEAADIERQLKKYQSSIDSGHRVLIVAHSQGALFANRVYKEIGKISVNKWRQQYIKSIFIAPASSYQLKKKNKTPSFTFDNDPISVLAHHFKFPITKNPNRFLKAVRSNLAYDEISYVDEKNETFHAFAYYMGKKVPLSDYNGSKMVFTNLGRDTILNYIQTQFKELEKVPSQWKVKEEKGCKCSEKYIEVTHRYEPTNLDLYLVDRPIKNFADKNNGKIYQVSNIYVRAKIGGVEIKENNDSAVCLSLLDESSRVIGEIKGNNKGSCDNNNTKPDNGDNDDNNDTKPGDNNTKPDNSDCNRSSGLVPSGIFTAYVSWSNSGVDGSISNALMGESAKSCTSMSIGSGSLTMFDVYPGTYPVTVSFSGYEDLNSSVTGSVSFGVSALGSYYMGSVGIDSKYAYGALGHIADIVIKRNENNYTKIEYVFRYGDSEFSLWGGSSVSIDKGIYNIQGSDYTAITKKVPPLCQPAKSCGCLPCSVAIIPYLSQGRLGPIGEATIKLYKANEYGLANSKPLFVGKTRGENRLDYTGIIELPVPYKEQPKSEYSKEQAEFMEKIKDYDGDFVLELSGGYDIDSDDDLKVDSNFKQVNGKLRLILSKEMLLNRDYKVNILTEIAFELSQDLLGSSYDKERLDARLNDIAKHILIEKIYFGEDRDISRDDLMWWVPAAHKNWLIKPYDKTLAPIVEKVYRGEDIYNDAYNYVYTKSYYLDVPILKSKYLSISEDAVGGLRVGSVDIVSKGSSDIEEFILSGEGSELFRVDKSGNLYLKDDATLDYESRDFYALQVVGVNSSGKSRPVTLYIAIKDVVDAPKFVSFSGSVKENAKSGAYVGSVKFNEGASPIESYELSGRDANSFSIDNSGVIKVKDSTSLDYEKSLYAKVEVRAKNSYGYSKKAPLYIKIEDELDVPEIEDIDVKLNENAKAGTQVAKAVIKSSDPIIDVELKGDGAENFVVDKDGVIRVASGAKIDYETRANYVLTLQATNKQGVSRASVIIRVQNMPDVPEIESKEYHILEGAKVGSKVGRVELKSSGSLEVDEYRVTGEDSSYFRVNNSGDIFVAKELLSRNEKPFYTIYIEPKNSNGVGLKRSEVIYVDTKRPIIGILDSWVYENAKEGTLVGAIPIQSAPSPIEKFEISGEGSSNFIIARDGTVRVAKDAKIDYEKKRSYTFRVRAKNSYGWSKESPLYIKVVDRDDTIVIKGFSATIYEDIKVGSVIGYVGVLKSGGKEISSFKISGDGSDKFSIYSDGRVVVNSNSLDNKIQNSYHLKVVALAKDGSQSNEAIVDIYIKDSLKKPLLEPLRVSIKEDVKVGTVVGKVKVLDNGGSEIEQFKLEGSNASDFSIDKNGIIKVAKALDYERIKEYHLKALAYTKKTSSSVKVEINILNLHDAPPVVNSRTLDIKEDSKIGSVIGKMDIDDRGEAVNNVRVYGEDNDTIVIDNNGTIRLNKNLDYEIKQYYEFEVEATNASGISNRAKLYLNIINVIDDEPVIKELNASISESAKVGDIVGQVEIFSQGSSPIERFELSGYGADSFSIDKNGTIRVAKKLDFEKIKEYKLYTLAYNKKAYSNGVNINIQVINALDTPPKIKDAQFEIDENVPIGTVVGSVPIVSQGEANITEFIIKGLGKEDFSIGQSGVLKVAKKLDYKRREFYYLTIQAKSIVGISNNCFVRIKVEPKDKQKFSIRQNSYNQFIGKINMSGFDGNYSWVTSHFDTSIYVDDNGNIYTEGFVKPGVYESEVSFYNENDELLYKVDVEIEVQNRIGFQMKFEKKINNFILDKNMTTAYISEGNNIHIVDISDSNKVKILKSIDVSFAITDMELSLDKKYLYCIGNRYFKIVDISKNTPQVISQLDMPTFSYFKPQLDSDFHNKRAYLALKNYIEVIDLSDILHPKEITKIYYTDEKVDTPDGEYEPEFNDIKISESGKILYSSVLFYGLYVLDISDLRKPKIIYNFSKDKKYNYEFGGWYRRMDFNKQYNIITISATNDTWISFFDVSDLNNITYRDDIVYSNTFEDGRVIIKDNLIITNFGAVYKFNGRTKIQEAQELFYFYIPDDIGNNDCNPVYYNEKRKEIFLIGNKTFYSLTLDGIEGL